MEIDSQAELTDQSSYLAPDTAKSKRYQTSNITTKSYHTKKRRNDSGKLEGYAEEISSSSEDEQDKATSPMDIKESVEILETVIINKERIMKKSEIATKGDPTMEKLNAYNAKQLKNVGYWLEKYFKNF